MYQLLETAAIREWLRSIKGGRDKAGKIRNGATLDSVQKMTGIPRNTLKWLTYKDTAMLGIERRRMLSKIIAQYENGTLDWKISEQGRGYRSKVAIVPDKPKVRARYSFTFGAKGPGLKAVDRPRLPGGMPTMKSLLGKD